MVDSALPDSAEKTLLRLKLRSSAFSRKGQRKMMMPLPLPLPQLLQELLRSGMLLLPPKSLLQMHFPSSTLLSTGVSKT